MPTIDRTMRSLVLLLAWPLALTAATGTTPEGLEYLKANKAKEGVVELPSGLQYRVLEKGTGLYHPSVMTPCSCHYEGTLTDGTVFDSSYQRGSPTEFAPNQVIGGWTEAMQLMVAGDKWELTIPSELAYGDRGSPPKIPGGSVLIFTLELLDLVDDTYAVVAMKCDAHTKDHCNEREIPYVDKIVAWEADKVTKELARLEGMKDAKAQAHLSEWIGRRIFLLKQLLVKEETKSADDEL